MRSSCWAVAVQSKHGLCKGWLNAHRCVLRHLWTASGLSLQSHLSCSSKSKATHIPAVNYGHFLTAVSLFNRCKILKQEFVTDFRLSTTFLIKRKSSIPDFAYWDSLVYRSKWLHQHYIRSAAHPMDECSLKIWHHLKREINRHSNSIRFIFQEALLQQRNNLQSTHFLLLFCI